MIIHYKENVDYKIVKMVGIHFGDIYDILESCFAEFYFGCTLIFILFQEENSYF